MPPSNRIPAYRLHKSSGRAVVTVDGRDIYLGGRGARHGDPETIAHYNEVVARWIAGGRSLPEAGPPALTVGDLADRYLAHARTYYRKKGRETRHVKVLELIARDLVAMFGRADAAGFGPRDFRLVRQSWVARGMTRDSANRFATYLRGAFRWAASEELLSAAVWHALKSVPGLPKGRSDAPERPPVGPAPEASVAAFLAGARPIYRDLARLQLCTAMRPTEACVMRAVDLDRSGPTWVYRPSEHKAEHHGKDRPIPLGPRARAIVEPRMAAQGDPSGPLFPSKYRPSRPCPRDTYAGAVLRFCRKHGLEPFHPHQLRHNALTRVRERFGPEAARVLGGHSDVATTTIYAKLDEAAIAARVAEEIG